MNNRFWAAVVLSLFVGCSGLQDATPTERDTFIRFYEKPANYYGTAMEITADGYVLGANTVVNTYYNTGYITITDKKGNVTQELAQIDSSAIVAIKGVNDGFIVLTNRYKVDPTAQQVDDVQKSSIQLIKITSSGAVGAPIIFGDSLNKTDFSANALTIADDGTVLAVGTVTPSGGKSSAIVIAFDGGTLQPMWNQVYATATGSNREYVNGKSAHAVGSKIIWASSLKEQTQDKSYLTVPFVKFNSNPDNSAVFGQNDDMFYNAQDIQPSVYGFAVIGTFSNTQLQPNVYFVQTDNSGSIIDGSQRYFDGISSSGNTYLTEANKTTCPSGCSTDLGNALAPTQDGGFILAGTFTSTTTRGNGGTDIWLIRLNATGDMVWNKLIGGSGNETVNSINVLPNGGYLISGSSDVNQLSSAFIIKTDSEGNL